VPTKANPIRDKFTLEDIRQAVFLVIVNGGEGKAVRITAMGQRDRSVRIFGCSSYFCKFCKLREMRWLVRKGEKRCPAK
jgi:hypothetical protein